jgi:tetratricopeptide (TPR) repeat protein
MKQAIAVGDSFNKLADARRFVEMNGLYLHYNKAQNVTSQITSILDKEPRYVPALFAHGIAQENSGDNIAARDRYQEVLKQFPLFAPAQKRLAILLAKSPSDASAPYQYALKAREALPDDPEVARVLGMLAFRRREYSRAAQLLEESSRKLTRDGEAFYYLGMAHFHLKQRNESRRALQQAVSLNATADFVPDARRILGQLN